MCSQIQKELIENCLCFALVPEKRSISATEELSVELEQIRNQVNDVKNERREIKQVREKMAIDRVTENKEMNAQAKLMNDTLKMNWSRLNSAKKRLQKKVLSTSALMRQIHDLKKRNQKLKEDLEDVNQSIIDLLTEQY